MLHNSKYYILNLILEYSYFEAGSLLLDITPATAITKFKYHRGQFANPDNHITFYQYMVKKYINTTNVDYKDDMIGLHGESNTEQIYLNGTLDFFRVIRPDIGKFAFHTLLDGINPFEVQDTGDSKIQELIFYHCQEQKTIPVLFSIQSIQTC